MLSRIKTRNSLRRRRLASLDFPEIGAKVSLAAKMAANTYSGVMVVVRFRVGRRRSADKHLRSNHKLSMYI